MTEFGTALGGGDTALFALMGEAVTYEPAMRSGVNGPSVADPGRPVASISGIFSEAVEAMDATAGGSYDPMTDRRLPHVSAQTSVTIRLADLAYAPQVGDRIVRVASGERRTVLQVRRDGMGFAVLWLNRAA